jgi:hypothetical protein
MKSFIAVFFTERFWEDQVREDEITRETYTEVDLEQGEKV